MSKRLNSYFGASQELRQLSIKAEQLLALQRHYERIALPSLEHASRVIQFEQQTLTLAANNSATAAKLRQLAPELVQLFQNPHWKVTRIQVRVQVTLPPTMHPPTAVSLSVTGREQLMELAMELPDSPLKNALHRLAKSRM